MKGNVLYNINVLTSDKWCQMFSWHSNYNVKHTRHAIQCQKFGGVQPHFYPWKNVFSHFSPMGKMGKVYGKRGKSIHFPLFPYTFFPIFPHGKKMGKHTIFHGQKWGWTPQNYIGCGRPKVFGDCRMGSQRGIILGSLKGR